MKKSEHKAPATLSTEGRRWWARLLDEYEIDDPAGLLLLQILFEAFDRMRGAQRRIKKDGSIIKDRFDQLRAHPAITTERDSRAQMLMAMKNLNLDIEPLRDGPGRQGGN